MTSDIEPDVFWDIENVTLCDVPYVAWNSLWNSGYMRCTRDFNHTDR